MQQYIEALYVQMCMYILAKTENAAVTVYVYSVVELYWTLNPCMCILISQILKPLIISYYDLIGLPLPTWTAYYKIAIQSQKLQRKPLVHMSAAIWIVTVQNGNFEETVAHALYSMTMFNS